jgi:hypothetical protein
VDPTRRGPDWMKIHSIAGSLFHERTQSWAERSEAERVARRVPGSDARKKPDDYWRMTLRVLTASMRRKVPAGERLTFSAGA